MNKHIQGLKNFKPPFWSRWLGGYRAWRRVKAHHKQWHYITTITVWATHTTLDASGRSEKKYNAWFVLSERGDGKRKYQFLEGAHQVDYKKGPTYARIIVPWLAGGLSNQQVKDWAKQTHTHAP